MVTQLDGICPSCGSSVSTTQRYTYNTLDQAVSRTDAGGRVTQYAYDWYSNLLTLWEAKGTTAERTAPTRSN